MSVSIRAMREPDLPEADRIFRLAFGTFLGFPEPLRFGGDTDFVRSRWRADPTGALAAELGGRFVGSNFAANWGSFGFFGPLSVRPDLWERGIAKSLLVPTMELFERWQNRQRGLFTFAHSPKHHALYQKFGFYPRYLTAVLSRAVADLAPAEGFARLSELPDAERETWLGRCREVTESFHEGLDLRHEILAVARQGLGDTLLLDPQGSRLAGFAVCHVGAGSEAGSGVCYAKFGAVRSSPEAGREFGRLVDACGAFARAAGATRLIAGVNLAREGAYRHLVARGFRAEIVGVAMQSGNDPGFNRPDVWAVDDWR